MRKSIYICLVLLTAVSCRISPEYGVKGTKMHLEIKSEDIHASYIKVDVKLDDDRHYYYIGAVPVSDYDVQKDNSRFMQLCMDSIYVDYVAWRYDLLVENEEYISTFESHYLYYGNQDMKILELKPETKYLVFSFCVNPKTKEPIGEFYYEYVTTKKFSRTDQTFEIKFTDKKDGAYATIIPSDDSRTFVYSLLNKKSLDGYYGGSGSKALRENLALYEKYHFLQYLYCSGFTSESCWYITEGEEYIIIVAGVDGNLTTDVYGMTFTYPFTEFHEYYESTE